MSSAHATLEELLGHLLAGRPVPEAVGDHAHQCAPCHERLELATRLAAAADLASLGTPTPELVARAWMRIARARLLDGVAEQFARTGRKLRHVLATLVGDSAIPSHAVRGQTTAHARVLVYETDDLGISVALGEPSEGGVAVKGQITPRHGETLPSQRRAIVAVRDECREVALDEFGAFDLGVLPSDTVHVAFVVGSTRVELPPVALGSEA